MRKAIIIGGGIAGLTLGIGLRQIRIEAEIYESAKTIARFIWTSGYRSSKVIPKYRKRSSRTHVALSLTTSMSTRDLSPTTPRGRSRVSGGATVGASVWREKRTDR
jgi:cation diffusion facilitator CzcD-associated flavoprotein CzcO